MTTKPLSPRAFVKAGAKLQEHRLENGLTLLLAERHLDPIVAVMVWYKVGARNESEREAGVSHFLEHMMFKGSARFGKGEVDLITTTLGGNNNAFTTPDHTGYWFELASDRWEKALEIEADRMRTLLFDPAEFEAEKAVVLEELAMGEDDPWRRLTHHVQAATFPRHPYRRPVIGFADTLKALSAADMRDYYDRFYHPANAVIVLCGDFDPVRALDAVRTHFGSIAAGPRYAQADCFRPTIDEPAGEHRLTMTWDDACRRLCIAWPTVRVGTDEDFALDLLSAVLSGGRMSRFHRKLVLEDGLATSISTNNDTRLDGGAFWLYAETAQGVEPAQLEAAIDAELARVRDELVSAAELTRAKKMLAASEAHDSETVSDLAEDLGEFAVDTRWQMAVEAIERIERTSAKDVRETARKLLTNERRVVGWSLPPAQKSAPTRPQRATRKKTAAQQNASRATARTRRAKSKSTRTRGARR